MSVKTFTTKRGDTMIEVIFAVAVFGLLSILAITTMNASLGKSEGNLEMSMARSEIDTQAEALRFIHSAATSEMAASVDDRTYQKKWNELIAKNQDGYSAESYQNGTSCSEIMIADRKTHKSFVIDVSNGMSLIDGDKIDLATTYPMIEGGKAYGIWINVKEGSKDSSGKVKYYDFYIHTCFDAVGSDVGTKLDSTVRLSNPSYMSS